jgi:acetylornithine/N-succinyldiaminopimelate aminotransferase
MSTSHLMSTYAPLAVSFEHGEGVWLYDSEGNKYLDAISGVGVCSLGHAHPAVTQAISEQASKLLHTSNLFQIRAQQDLADALTRVGGMDKVFFSNSGAEANEAAIKIARLYASQREIKNPAIIVLDNAFHGRTLATLSASGSRKVQAGFEPLVSGFVRAPYNDLEAIRTIARNNNQVVAILIEPIQGEAGINMLDEGYLEEIRKICDEQQWLMILDEVQTGNGRTGTYFAYQQTGIVPDVLTTAKGLGNGVPIGACMTKGESADVFRPGNHGSTFGGNPLACAAANAVIKTIEEQKLAQHAADIGQQIRQQLTEALTGNPHIVEIRGNGLMIGIELDQDCAQLVAQAKDKGLLINVTVGKVVRLLPPLIISQDEAKQVVSILAELINQL